MDKIEHYRLKGQSVDRMNEINEAFNYRIIKENLKFLKS